MQLQKLNEQGYSFLEVLMAAAILAVTVLMTLNLTTYFSQNKSYTQHRVEGMILAANFADDISTGTQNSPRTLGGPHTTYFDASGYECAAGTSCDCTGTGCIYKGKWTVTRSGSGFNVVIDVGLTISWSDLGITHTVYLHSIRGTH